MQESNIAPGAIRNGAADRAARDYNYERFLPKILMKDAQLIQHPEGTRPGERAPDFSLHDTEGRLWQLQDLQGKPVIFLVGSGTCPVTQGNLPGLRSLYQDYGDCQWLMLYVREAHPGEQLSAHRSYEQKRRQAAYFREVAEVPWPVLVDELDGAVHKQYGLLPNSVFLIDADGRVAFVGEISHAPTLRRALDQLAEQGDRGPVLEGEDKTPHMLGPTAYGWEALKRGGRLSMRDVAVRMPPLAMNLWLGDKSKLLLSPIASRSRSLSPGARLALGLGAGALLGLAVIGAARALQGPKQSLR